MAVACKASTPSPPVARPAEPPAERVRESEPEPALPVALYAADEALKDVLSGGLEHVGTGRWPGIERSSACAFRNGRVVVVNAYCTVTETQAFRVDVYSRERGRLRVYAEGKAPLSRRSRADYFSFVVESEPPAPAERATTDLLSMSYADLAQYEQQRYDALLPGCYGGEKHDQPIGGCLGALAPRAGQWAARNRAFLDHASDDWYRVVRVLRWLALRHGTDPR